MNIFEQVKSMLCMSDVVKFYGLQINHSGMCNCPFHNDKTPSMKIYDNNFYCFGCGEHGDVTGFTAKLFGISQLEAAKKLNYDFGLHIETDKPLSQNQITIYHNQQAEQREFSEWEQSAWQALSEYFKLLRDWRSAYAPNNPDEPFDHRFVESLNNYDYSEYLCNCFINASKDEKLKMKDEVTKIEQRLCKHKREQITAVAHREEHHKRGRVL
ncbi:MAG: CHC2 zinc finger domain-containing protein [Oscillospiraceae bacterium]|nr:CHC2 zinc finger domain-containing protein [Oscillospiraceae bacterium]